MPEYDVEVSRRADHWVKVRVSADSPEQAHQAALDLVTDSRFAAHVISPAVLSIHFGVGAVGLEAVAAQHYWSDDDSSDWEVDDVTAR